MKKGFFIVCLGILFLACAVLADDGDLAIHKDFSSIAAEGDTVYLLDGNGGLHILQSGQAFPETSACTLTVGVDFLLADQGTLYGWNSGSGALFRIDTSSGAVTEERVLQTADLLTESPDYSVREFVSPVLHEGVLTAFCYSEKNCIVQYAPDGKRSIYPLKADSARLTCNDDGDVWVAQYEGGAVQLYQLGAQGKLSKLRDLPADTWDIASYGETLYAGVGNRVEQYASLKTKESQPAAYLPETPFSSYALLLLGGERAALVSNGTFYLRHLDTDRVMRTLTLPDPFYNNPEINAAFQAEHPDVALRFVDVHPRTGEEFQLALAQAEPDILWCEPAYNPWRELKRKGYAADLSSSALLQQTVEGMYPAFRNAFMSEDKTVGIPFEYWLGWTLQIYRGALLDKTGLTEEQLPKTFLDLPAFLQLWADQYAQENPNIEILGAGTPHTLCMLFMEQYAALYESRGEPLVFDTPLFRAGIAMKDQAPELQSQDREGVWGGLVSSGGELLYYANEAPRVFALPLNTEQPYMLPVSPRLMFVNPNSLNIDLAIAYLENAVHHMTPQQRALWMPGDGQPVPNPDYDAVLAQYAGYVEEVRAEMEKATGAERARWEDRLADQQELYDYIAQTEHWLVSPEFLAVYGPLAEHAYVSERGFFSWDEGNPARSRNISDLCERYLNGQIDADAFVEGLQRIADMQRLEDE